MTSTQTLAAEARHLRQVVGRQIPKIRAAVERHPDQAKTAFDILHGLTDAVLRIMEMCPEHVSAMRHEQSHVDIAHILDAMTNELRWLADVISAGDSHVTRCPN